jgi:hypothetical protein
MCYTTIAYCNALLFAQLKAHLIKVIYLKFMHSFIHNLLPVRIYLILFYIERGLLSRTEIEEREMNGSTVHNMGAVGNRILFCQLSQFHNSELFSFSEWLCAY